MLVKTPKHLDRIDRNILVELQKTARISNVELANKVGKKRPYISRIEKGEDIKLSNFSLLVSALNLSIELKPA